MYNLKPGSGRAVVTLAALLAVGCGGEEAMSTLRISITDAPVENATTVWLQFTGVEVKPANGPAEMFIFTTPRGYDLLTLQNGNAATLLDDTSVPAGRYEWVRLHLDPTPGSSYVIDATGQHGLRIPSGAQSGLKLVRGFTMPAGGRADFTVDFMLQESIIAPPGQSPDYLMKPVLRITNNIETGTIAGVFAAPTLAAIPACASAAPRVYLYTGAGVMPDDLYNPLDGPPDTAPDVAPLVTTTAGLNGAGQRAYLIGFVPAGTYTVAFTCDNDDPAVDENTTTPLNFIVHAAPVVVTAGQTATANF